MIRKKIKKLQAVILIAAVLLSFGSMDGVEIQTVFAAESSKNIAEQVITALEIMQISSSGSYSASKPVTRGAFARMLVNLSGNKGKVSSTTNVDLFPDVSAKNAAAGYIKIAIDSGWMSGYVDGYFKPDKAVTLLEAVNGVLRVIGYSNEDFSGNTSNTQMAYYQSKKLNANITKTKNQSLNRKDCMNLFYNVLKAENKEGKVYAETLSYVLDSNGEVDYTKLVSDNLTGPVIAGLNWGLKLPFKLSEAVCYKDGVLTDSSKIEENHVIYYSKSQKTIWVYSKRITGMVDEILPDKLSPSSVTIAGNSYNLGSQDMISEFGVKGSVQAGDVITALLGRDNCIAGVLLSNEYDAAVTGVVLETGTRSNTANNDGTFFKTYLKMADTSGVVYEYGYDGKTTDYSSGNLIQISYQSGVMTITKLERKVFSGKINSAGTKLGTYGLAEGVHILDYKDGSYTSVYPGRLSGVTLTESSVLYYETDSSGNITDLILNDVTGDLHQYGIILGVTGGTGNSELSVSKCNYDIGGTAYTASTYMQPANITKGPNGFLTDSKLNTILSIVSLSGKQVSAINGNQLQLGTVNFLPADQMLVYYYTNSEYHAATLDKVSNLETYTLTAYYDKIPESGGRIRIIVAK